MSDYDIEAMRRAIKQCDENIKTFEDAIDRERDTQREYRRIIGEIEAKLDGSNNTTVFISTTDCSSSS